MVNERKTEALVEKRLRERDYFAGDVAIEKQQSDSPRIKKLLANASKRGNGAGYPEFIITRKHAREFLIVIECKAETRKHISKTLDQYGDYAVDGVLLYASFLSKEFDVLAIAVSGDTEQDLRISHYLHLRGQSQAVEFSGARDILSFSDYHKALLESDVKFRQDYNALLDYSIALNKELHHKKIKEANRGLLISGILIALQDKAFVGSFRAQRTAQSLARSLVATIDGEFQNAGIGPTRIANLKQAFSFLTAAPSLTTDKDFFIDLIQGIDDHINGFMRTHKYYDTVGQFYIEFLRYANNDKGLGIVLTPPHVGELFADLAGVDHNSVVLDNCCGTAGLLLAAMKRMIRDAGADEEAKKRIRTQQLIGIEFQDDIYALAVSNMILHGDGMTNVHRGDCFADVMTITASTKVNVGLLNPPYKTSRNDKEELEFVWNNLDALERDGTCIAIVPITCATAASGDPHKWKRKLLERHTLEAVMSMPPELFHNSKVNVVTCVMVFTAHRPHPNGKKTWFGYWRDDGFVKTKYRGRIDANGTWQGIKAKWLTAYRNRELVNALSVTSEVGPDDEWCAEAYMQTDYSTLRQEDFEREVKRFALYKLMLDVNAVPEDKEDTQDAT